MQNTDLLHLFTADLETAQGLLDLIDAEFQALSNRDLPLLEQLLAKKLPLLSLLDQHGKLRSQVLTGLSLSLDRVGLESYAASHTQGRELLSASDDLDQLLISCRQANERNARLIRANQASLKNVLGILREGETPSLYDSSGGTARINSQRPISQA